MAATWQSPGREMSETNTRQPARPRWLTAERSEPSVGWMGIKPNNKIIVVFPSSVLPSRRFGNPPSPEGEGLIGHGHDVISSVRDGLFRACATVYKEQHYTANRTRLSFRALVEKSPATETRTIVHAPAKCPHGHRALPAEAHRPDLPLISRCATAFPRGEALIGRVHEYPKANARTGSVPRQPTRPRRLSADA